MTVDTQIIGDAAHETADKKAVKLAEKMLDLMEALTEVMEREIEMLGQKDYAAMEALRKDKLRMTRDYQIHMALVAENDNGVKAAPALLKEQLRDIGLKLARVSERNAAMLQTAITGTQNFLQTIMHAAKKKCLNMDSYNDPRKAKSALGTYSPIVNPVAVDRSA